MILRLVADAGDVGDEPDKKVHAGMPEFVILLARAAYINDIVVSLMLQRAGEQFTNMSVFAVPPIESCMICVSLWFRYGTCFCFLTTASMTSPSADKERLISIASFICGPLASDFFNRSDPPKSHKSNLPETTSPVSRFRLVARIVKMRWDRELSMFIALAATVLWEMPLSSNAFSSAASCTSFSARQSTWTAPAWSWRKLSFGELSWKRLTGRSKSIKVLLYSSTIDAVTLTL
mmetsp:Transcript_24862/g.71806  ORF Transcript_24862/g.71806 Transcript_24862/m.71806 type:complete len:234 (+) Transcript_24862:316-1017(+)